MHHSACRHGAVVHQHLPTTALLGLAGNGAVVHKHFPTIAFMQLCGKPPNCSNMDNSSSTWNSYEAEYSSFGYCRKDLANCFTIELLIIQLKQPQSNEYNYQLINIPEPLCLLKILGRTLN